MHTADLATSCQVASGPAVRAIGWLGNGTPFSTGSVDPDLPATLTAHLRDRGRWLPMVTAGVHFCDLGGCPRTGGSQYVIIPSRRCLYVAPDLLGHYLDTHAYAPPVEFVEAVLACPEQSSDGYLELLLPFARSTWHLDAEGVYRIAASARLRREA